MIAAFVKVFDANRARLLEIFSEAHPGSYHAIVLTVIQMLNDVLENDNDYDGYPPDPKRVTTIDHGDYQGTLLFIIAATGYQPSTFWYAKIGYGSCSHCDTYQAIYDEYHDYDSEVSKPNASQANQYLTLALHIVQGLKLMGEEI